MGSWNLALESLVCQELEEDSLVHSLMFSLCFAAKGCPDNQPLLSRKEIIASDRRVWGSQEDSSPLSHSHMRHVSA